MSLDKVLIQIEELKQSEKEALFKALELMLTEASLNYARYMIDDYYICSQLKHQHSDILLLVTQNFGYHGRIYYANKCS